MITKIPADKRHLAEHGWLKTYHLFSFANYYDPSNIHFGALRVFNDDHIDGESGFGDHSHDNMEIITIVLEGELTHKDSMGNTGIISAGEVQYMSAGTGVTHAEMNTAQAPVHLYQIWIIPKERDLMPRYAQKDFSNISNTNILLPVASGSKLEGSLDISTDSTIYTSTLEAHQTITHRTNATRGIFIYLRAGKVTVNGVDLEAFDQGRIQQEETITITAAADAKFVLIDVPITL